MRMTKYVSMTALAACTAISFSACAAGGNWRERASREDEMRSGDVAAEVAFGREIAARILGRYKPYNNPALIKYVNLVGLALVRNTNRPELHFHFMVLDTNDVNAYAAPGGYVFVTTGALQAMTDESELAGVLAHEIGHVTERHVVKELAIKGSDDSATGALVKLVGGSSESAKFAFAQAVDKGVDMIFKDVYKREDELQADRFAVLDSSLSGYDGTSLARYLDRIRAIKDKALIDDPTHPSVDVRIEQINRIAAADGVDIGNSIADQQRFVAETEVLRSDQR